MKVPVYPDTVFWKRLQKLQEDVFECLEFLYKRGESGKRYEGTFAVRFNNDGTVAVEFHCYMIGPSRHYTWESKVPEAALDEAERDIREWIEEEYKTYENIGMEV